MEEAIRAADPDWTRLRDNAVRHGVFPIVHRNLARLGYPGESERIREDLERHVAINGLRNKLLAGELARILGLLANAGIPAIPLKGLALSQELYGDLSLRFGTDLDVLVRPAHVRQARGILQAAGFQGEDPEGVFDDASLRSNVKDFSLVRKDGEFDYPLDLHWGVAWGMPMDRRILRELWGGVRAAEFRGVACLRPAPVWEAVYLSGHAALHRWEALKWLVDLADWLEAKKISREALLAASGRVGWSRAVTGSLSAIDRAFGMPGPRPGWLRAIQDRPAGPLSPPRESADFRLMDAPSDRLQFVLRALLLPRPRDGKRLRLPRPLHFLYTPVRVGYLGWKMATRSFKSVMNRRG